MRRRHWAAVMVLAVLGIAGMWIGMAAGPAPQPVTPVTTSNSPAAAAPVAAAPEAAASAPAVLPVAALLPSCPYQHVDIAGSSGPPERACLAATRLRQRGSLRGYVLAPQGLSTWQLVVEGVAGDVQRVRLSRPAQGALPAALYGCDGGACRGVALGRPDPHGVRSLTLDDVSLQALTAGARRGLTSAPGAAAPTAALAGLPPVRAHAVLSVPPDSRQLACIAPTVNIVERDGASTEFCPMGGAGFELADNGQPRFEFRSLDGRTLAIALAGDGSVEQLELGAWRCRAPACGGVGMSAQGDPADPLVERHFSFSGTSLLDGSSQRPAATLSGRLVMPAQ